MWPPRTGSVSGDGIQVLLSRFRIRRKTPIVQRSSQRMGWPLFSLNQGQDFEKVRFDFENVNPVTLRQSGRYVIINKMCVLITILTSEWK